MLSLHMELEKLKAKRLKVHDSVDSIKNQEEFLQTEEKVIEVDKDVTVVFHPHDTVGVIGSEDVQSVIT